MNFDVSPNQFILNTYHYLFYIHQCREKGPCMYCYISNLDICYVNLMFVTAFLFEPSIL